jgi:hypothetical protein
MCCHGAPARRADHRTLVGRTIPSETVEESVVFDPYDPALPTYSGHATVHTTNLEDSPNASVTNTVILRGTDGSHLQFHEDLHIVVTPSGIVVFVDHRHARC